MAAVRYPFYGMADVTVDVARGAHGEAVDAIVRALEDFGARSAA
jgi:shikimate kinase